MKINKDESVIDCEAEMVTAMILETTLALLRINGTVTLKNPGTVPPLCLYGTAASLTRWNL